MARKTVLVSDLTGKEIGDAKDSATITITYGDARRGVVRLDVLDRNILHPLRQHPLAPLAHLDEQPEDSFFLGPRDALHGAHA